MLTTRDVVLIWKVGGQVTAKPHWGYEGSSPKKFSKTNARIWHQSVLSEKTVERVLYNNYLKSLRRFMLHNFLECGNSFCTSALKIWGDEIFDIPLVISMGGRPPGCPPCSLLRPTLASRMTHPSFWMMTHSTSSVTNVPGGRDQSGSTTPSHPLGKPFSFSLPEVIYTGIEERKNLGSVSRGKLIFNTWIFGKLNSDRIRPKSRFDYQPRKKIEILVSTF